MKLILIVSCLLVATVGLLVSAGDIQTNNNVEALSHPPATRRRFELPEILSIEKYQKLFNKHYGSLAEKLQRMQILLVKGFYVFVAAAKYLRGSSLSFKKINHLSDRTKDELAQMSNKRDASRKLDGKVRRRRDAGRSQDGSSRRGRHLKPDDLFEHPMVTRSKARRDNSFSDDDSSKKEKFNKGEEEEEKSALSEETADELASMLAGLKFKHDDQEHEDESQSSSSDGSLTGDEILIDHRDCLTPPRDQGYIGVCYAFSSVGLAEWLHCQQSGEMLQFSEQFIVDCGNGFRSLEGADGGFERDVGAFIGKFGLQLLDDYPFVGALNACPYDREKEPQLMGSVKFEDYAYRETALEDIEVRLRETPLIASIDIGDQWHEYGGGVYENPGYDAEDAETHSVLIVGSGRQDGVDYWLIRNSHGPNWGEGGYVKLSKSCPCIYLNRAYRPNAVPVKPIKNPLHEPRKVEIRKDTTVKKNTSKKRKKKRTY